MKWFDRIDIRAKFIVIYAVMLGLAFADAYSKSAQVFMGYIAVALLSFLSGLWLHTFRIKRKLKGDNRDE